MKDFYIEVGERIRKYRKLSNLTLEELGNRIGVQKSTVRKYETGMIRVSHEKLETIAGVLGIDVSLLYGEGAKSDIIQIPVYGRISCGGGAVIYEEPLGQKMIPKSWAEHGIHFFLTAQGDSMTGAKIHEGDMLLIRRQESVEDGEIAAVVVDDECFLKRVYRNNGTFTLVSENPNYPPIIFDPADGECIRILGKLVRSITVF